MRSRRVESWRHIDVALQLPMTTTYDIELGSIFRGPCLHAAALFEGDNVRNVAGFTYSAASRLQENARLDCSSYFETKIDMISNVPVIVCHQ